MLKRTKVEINKKVFDIVYKKENVSEGELFQGKVLLERNVLEFSLLKRKDRPIEFQPMINEQHKKLVIEAIENNEKKDA